MQMHATNPRGNLLACSFPQHLVSDMISKDAKEEDSVCIYLQVVQPVRARVELRRVCLALESRAKRWIPPCPLDDADSA